MEISNKKIRSLKSKSCKLRKKNSLSLKKEVLLMTSLNKTLTIQRMQTKSVSAALLRHKILSKQMHKERGQRPSMTNH